jgi:NAD-specific glutamate dehydrogenase
MNNEQLHRDLGRVEGEVKALRRDVSAIDGKLDAALAYIEQQKGARRATVFISSGASAVVAAVVGWAVTMWEKIS